MTRSVCGSLASYCTAKKNVTRRARNASNGGLSRPVHSLDILCKF